MKIFWCTCMLSRDWQCQSCGAGFHSYDHGNPPCPHCGGRADWVPGGGHIATEQGKGATRTMRSLAEAYGMSDMNTGSPSRLNRAMPHSRGIHAQPDKSLGIKHFAPGFAAHFHPTLPTCGPSLIPPDARHKVSIGARLPRSASIGGPMMSTKIEGRYYPKSL